MANDTTDTVGETGVDSIPCLSPHLRTFSPYDLDSAKQRDAAIRRFCLEFLKEGEDYQKLDFHDKHVLAKPGAEKLVIFCGLEPRITSKDETLDWTGRDHNGEPFFYALYRYTMFQDGVVKGEGEGSANSWEEKHRYRWVPEARIPVGLDKASLPIRASSIFEYDFAIRKAETTGKYGKPAEYWKRFEDAKRNGTGRVSTKVIRSTGSDETGIEIDSTLYRVPNESAPDVVNTTQKMAQKRAYICSTIMATGVSGLFTQDLEDMPPEMFDRPKTTAPPEPKKASPAPAQTSRPVSAAQSSAPPATQAPPVQRTAPSGDRLKGMQDSFAELRKECPAAWFRRQTGYADISLLTIEQGIPLYVGMRDFVAKVKTVEALQSTVGADAFGRAQFDAGVSDPWEFSTLKDLQEFVSVLQQLQGVSA